MARDSQLAKYALQYKRSLDEVDTKEMADKVEDDEEPKGLMARRT